MERTNAADRLVGRAIAGDRDALSSLLERAAGPLANHLRGRIAQQWLTVLDDRCIRDPALLRPGRVGVRCVGGPPVGCMGWNRGRRGSLPSDDPLARGLEVVRLPCSDRLANDYYRPMTRREKAQVEAGS